MASRHKHGMIAAAVAGSLCLAGIVNAQAPSAATPATPNPSAAAPASPPGSTTMQSPSLAASPIQMPSAVPNKAETAPSAFDKLATSGATSVSKQETDKLVGFDRAFTEADRDKDGKLTKDEFNLAWAIYTGRT
jgi:hypothetical protein